MPEKTPEEWAMIRAEYEQGTPQRRLAAKFGISQAAISQRAKREEWVINKLIIPITDDNPPAESDNPFLTLVYKAIRDLAKHLEFHLDLREHKLLADALSQYTKVKLAFPDEDQAAPFDLRDFLAGCTDEELEQLRPILLNVQARIEAEQEKIRPIKKVG